MEASINHKYLLSETAMRIWQTNDEDGQNKMLVYITDNYKEKWFRGMIYYSNIIPAHQLREIAGDAFIDAWKDFNERGKAGKIKFSEVEYVPYLKQSLRNIFIKRVNKEIKEREAVKEYNRRDKSITETEDQEIKHKLLHEKLQKILNTLSAEEKDLMHMRYEKKLSYAVIATKLNILEKSCVQRLYRAKKSFIKKWKNDK